MVSETAKKAAKKAVKGAVKKAIFLKVFLWIGIPVLADHVSIGSYPDGRRS